MNENGDAAFKKTFGVYQETIKGEDIGLFFKVSFNEPQSLRNYLFTKVSAEIDEEVAADFIGKNRISYELSGEFNYKLVSRFQMEEALRQMGQEIEAAGGTYKPKEILFLLQPSRVAFNHVKDEAVVCVEFYPLPPLAAGMTIIFLKKDKTWEIIKTYHEGHA